MIELSFFLFGIIVYVYAGYPILLAIISLFVRRPVRKEPIRPTVALMIAAYNEELDIQEKIENCLKLNYPNELLEIYVVSDGSEDKTDEIAGSYADRGVKLIRVEGRVGKTEARNVALRQVSSEIIVFSDATTIYDQNVVEKLVQNFADERVGMATGHLKYIDPAQSQVGAGQKLFWRYESFLKRAQTNLGTLTGSVGCISAFRRSAYTELPANIIEDFTEPLMFVLKGYRVVFEEEAVCYERTTKKSAQEWSMRVRVIRGGLAGMIYARALLNPFKHPLACFQLLSHKLLRWLVPVVAIFLFVASGVAVLSDLTGYLALGLFGSQALFYLFVGLAFLLEARGSASKALGIPHYLFIVNAASLAAIYKTITTPLETNWETDRGE